MQFIKSLSSYPFIACFKAESNGLDKTGEPATEVQKPINASYPPFESIKSVNLGISDKSLKNCAVTSTGFIGEANGTSFFNSSCASFGIGPTVNPSSAAASAIITPPPPEMVTNPKFFPAGNILGIVEYATSNISSVLLTLYAPCALNTSS